MLKVILFYKYTPIKDTAKFKEEHLAFCKSIGLRGRILVASEGINGSVSGTPEQIEKYKEGLRNDARFSEIEFKEEDCLMHPFHKENVKIKIKPELVRFEQEVDLANTGVHLTPQEFLEMASEENVVILDARNDYESRVGKFKNAITPDISTFREFAAVTESLEDKKDKKILMYCTGGIRCEKASAFLKGKGFENVYQLHGGILNFSKELPNTIWEGKCFVFDKRLVSDMCEVSSKPLTNCEICGVACDLYKNCRNVTCDAFTVTCLDCEREFGGCCSRACYAEFKEMRDKKTMNVSAF